MSIWTALIIVQAATTPLQNATPLGPFDLAVGEASSAGAEISVKVQPVPTAHVERMTGVETNTYVSMPATVTLAFPTDTMCETAAVGLRKQAGILSVSCVQIQ